MAGICPHSDLLLHLAGARGQARSHLRRGQIGNGRLAQHEYLDLLAGPLGCP